MTRVAFEDLEHGFRVVETERGPVVEVVDGVDATGERRWSRAHVNRAREGHAVLEGWKAICGALGIASRDTAMQYARRSRDPLPVRRSYAGTPWIFKVVLEAWLASQHTPERLIADEWAGKKRAPRRRREPGDGPEGRPALA